MFFLTWALRGQVLGGTMYIIHCISRYMYKSDQGVNEVFKVLSICLES